MLQSTGLNWKTRTFVSNARNQVYKSVLTKELSDYPEVG